jgi:hypothetical protein
VIHNILPAAVAMLLFVAFVGYLAVKVAALPLALIVGAVVAMCAIDFALTLREGQ